MSVSSTNLGNVTAQLVSGPPLAQQTGQRSFRVGVVIPTYNAESHWSKLSESLLLAGILPEDVLVIDSSSRDRTPDLARQSGFRLVSIPQAEFNHGGTRQLAVDYLGDVDAVIMITQDAVLVGENSITELCKALEDPQVGAAYGRQLARAEADAIEQHSRLFNYPGVSRSCRLGDRKVIGIRAASLSNSFAIYRRAALEQVGGFPTEVIFAEDSFVAARMLMAGWAVTYVSEATVVHSHNFTVLQEFRRYFDIGVHHARERWLLATFGTADGEGLRYIRSEFQYLRINAPHLIPEAFVRTLSKLVAYRLGRAWKNLPMPIVKKLSGSPQFWAAQTRNITK